VERRGDRDPAHRQSAKEHDRKIAHRASARWRSFFGCSELRHDLPKRRPRLAVHEKSRGYVGRSFGLAPARLGRRIARRGRRDIQLDRLHLHRHRVAPSRHGACVVGVGCSIRARRVGRLLALPGGNRVGHVIVEKRADLRDVGVLVRRFRRVHGRLVGFLGLAGPRTHRTTDFVPCFEHRFQRNLAASPLLSARLSPGCQKNEKRQERSNFRNDRTARADRRDK
jgi:hypothetical protein